MPPVGSKSDSYKNMQKQYQVGWGGGVRNAQGFPETFFLKLNKMYTDIDDANKFLAFISSRDDPEAIMPPELRLNDWCP